MIGYHRSSLVLHTCTQGYVYPLSHTHRGTCAHTRTNTHSHTHTLAWELQYLYVHIPQTYTSNKGQVCSCFPDLQQSVCIILLISKLLCDLECPRLEIEKNYSKFELWNVICKSILNPQWKECLLPKFKLLELLTKYNLYLYNFPKQKEIMYSSPVNIK